MLYIELLDTCRIELRRTKSFDPLTSTEIFYKDEKLSLAKKLPKQWTFQSRPVAFFSEITWRTARKYEYDF